MKLRLIKDCGLAVALLATGFSLHAAETPKADAAKSSPPAKTEAKADAKASAAASSSDVQKVLEQFAARRDSIIASHEALKEQLKNATEEKKKELMAQIERERKELLEQQRTIGKQIRDDMRKQKQNAAATPPR